MNPVGEELDHGGAEEENEQEEESEGREVFVKRKPSDPTQEEIDQHMCTHIPFRSWCAHCVMGKAKNQKHKKR